MPPLTLRDVLSREVTEERGAVSIAVGDVLGGFVIEGIAGRGGMGVVYRARQREPDRIVALKVIAPGLASDSTFQARFRRESTMAAQIEHPNVIPVYSIGEDRGLLFLAMRFVEGTDLRTLLANEGRLDPHRAALIVDQVAQALDDAHAHGLVHRDVKPANILVSRGRGREHVYLTDFGIARAVESNQTMTATGALLGTVDYVAPEQALGDRVDSRTDVYSLGCVLFEALTGTVPYPRASDTAKLLAHTSEPPPSVTARVDHVPHELDRVVARAMAKSPEERYLSAGDLGRATLAAAGGISLSRAEQSVATGTAAPLEAAPVPPQRPVSRVASGSVGASGAATAPRPEAEPATVRRAGVRAPRRRGILAGVVIGVAAVVAVVVALTAGGSGSPSSVTPAPTGSHGCGQISFSPGAPLSSSDYGVGNIRATSVICSVAREVARGVRNIGGLAYAAGGFTCVGTATAAAAGARKHWRCTRGRAVVTFFSVGV